MALARLMGLGIAAGIAAVTVSCSDTFAPPDGLSLAAAVPACGPAGGPAVTIYLASEPIQSGAPSAPYVRIYINQSVDELAGHSWAVAGSGAEAAAWHYTTATDFELASNGGVTITEVDDDNTIEGFVDIVFPTAGRIRGDFRAEWVPQQLGCL